MSLLNILEFPDTRLRTVAKPVMEVDSALQVLIDDMLETMYDAPGIGLAATQVDVHKRIVVMDLSEDASEPLVLKSWMKQPSQRRRAVCLCPAFMKPLTARNIFGSRH